MNYLLDKKIKRKKYIYAVIFFIILIFFFYFRQSIFNGLSYSGNKLFRPILILGHNVGEKFSGFGSFFTSRNALDKENKNLKSKIDSDKAEMLNYNSILLENIHLKEILGRIQEKDTMILSAIVGRQKGSAYGTLIIDAGTGNNIKEGDTVFALGNIPIGRIATTYPNSSKVILFTSAGEKTQVVVSDKPAATTEVVQSGGDVLMEMTGRGGGNFEMVLPRDFTLLKGDQAVFPGITPYVVGIVETIISDPRDPFIKALLVSPVNVAELKFVEVKERRQ